ncbi:MAG: hypothetical protein KF901_28010, partial [Myxococcales bacterium]|nr:hypothetical protein [Myxococcales bacterium]
MTFDPFQHRVQLFTGKGGVGKSSVIAALALTAAEEGHRPLIVELSHRATFGALFGEDLGYEPREVAPGVFATHVRDEDAVHDYVLERVKLRGVARRIVEQPALARFFEAAPAVAEVATLHRLTRLADAGAYHPIFVDLDATGHALMFLELPRVFEGLTGAGPLRALLERATALLHDGERTILHLVTLPAELPARETRQLHAALVGSSEDRASRAASGAGTVALGALFVNRVPREPLSAAEAALVEGRPGEVCEEDLALARRAQREHAAALEQLSRLTRELGLPSVGLPEVPALRRAVDLASLAVLGRAAVGQLRAGAGAGAGVGVGVGAGFEAGSASGSGSEAGSEARSEAGGGSEVASRSEVASGSGSASASGAGAGAESGAGAEL